MSKNDLKYELSDLKKEKYLWKTQPRREVCIKVLGCLLLILPSLCV